MVPLSLVDVVPLLLLSLLLSLLLLLMLVLVLLLWECDVLRRLLRLERLPLGCNQRWGVRALPSAQQGRP